MSDSGAREKLRDLISQAQSSDASEQLTYLEDVLGVIGSIGHPRLKPVQKKLNKAYANLGRGAAAGKEPEVLVRELANDLDALRRQTYDLLSSVTTQLKSTLRSRRGAFPPAERERMEQLCTGLGHFSTAMRKMIAANKNKDPKAREAAKQAMAQAHTAMT